MSSLEGRVSIVTQARVEGLAPRRLVDRAAAEASQQDHGLDVMTSSQDGLAGIGQSAEELDDAPAGLSRQTARRLVEEQQQLRPCGELDACAEPVLDPPIETQGERETDRW